MANSSCDCRLYRNLSRRFRSGDYRRFSHPLSARSSWDLRALYVGSEIDVAPACTGRFPDGNPQACHDDLIIIEGAAIDHDGVMITRFL